MRGDNDMNETQENVYRKKSQAKEVWWRLKKNKSAMIGLAIICVLVLVAVFADVIADYDLKAITQNPSQRLLPPSSEHWFGTDDCGRDVFARIVHGARISLSIGVVTVLLSVLLGGIFGAVAGFYGGKVDGVIMRIMDTILCIPGTLLTLALAAALGPGTRNLLIAIAVSSVPGFTRVIRSAILPVLGQDFIEAARACGTRDWRIIVKHILPNAIGPIIVQATMAISTMIITTSALSYIGMGIDLPRPEWGAMLSEARDFMRTAPTLIIFPGVAIVLAALSFNLLGDGLRDALDPKLKN